MKNKTLYGLFLILVVFVTSCEMDLLEQQHEGQLPNRPMVQQSAGYLFRSFITL